MPRLQVGDRVVLSSYEGLDKFGQEYRGQVFTVTDVDASTGFNKTYELAGFPHPVRGSELQHADRATHYKDRDKHAFAPALCGARGGTSYHLDKEVTCPECVRLRGGA